jgi:hypothetical protein
VGGRAPRRRDSGEVGPPSGGRRARGCPDAGRSLPCPPRPVRRGMSVQPVERTSNTHASGVQASGASRCPAGQASGVRGAAAALSAPWTRSGSVWRAAPAGRSGSTCRRGLWAAWSPAGIGPDGKGMLRRWPWLARTRVDVAQAAAWPASRLRRRLGPAGPTRALVQGQGAGRGRGSMGQSRCSPAPAGCPGGQVVGVVPDHGPGPRGGDHAVWSLGEGWSGGVQLRRPTRFGGGAARGRAAAAAH